MHILTPLLKLRIEETWDLETLFRLFKPILRYAREITMRNQFVDL